MKNIIIYLTLFLIFVNYQNIFSQNKELLTEKTLVMLNDSSLTMQQGALFNIIEYDLIDTKNYLEENFWDIARSNQSLALRVLSHLNSNLTVNYAYRLIDTLEKNPYDQSKYFEAYQSGPFVPEELVEIADILFSAGDFSKENYVFELAQVYSINEFSSKFIKPLSKMAKNSPTNSTIAKNLLTNIIFNAEDEYYRNEAIISLEAAIGSEIVPVLIKAYQEDSSSTNRFYVLNEYLSKYHNEFNADSLLKAFLLTETEKELRLHISKILLYGLGSIPNYIFVKEYLDEEPDPTIRTLMEFEVEEGVPALFDDNNTIEVCIDTMISITDQVYNLNWFGDLAFSYELKNILTTAKTNLQNGDSLACRVQVKAFQDLVDNVYKDSLNTDARFVTIEGWKFLYWNAQYILDRLPEPTIVVNADIEAITPAMSLVNPGSFTMEIKGTGFTTNSVVYLSGNARTTTFVADTLLTAEIQSTDVSVAGNYPVWVSDGTTNSDTLTFSVVSTLPKPVRPVLECVTNNGDGTYTAYFGYKNENSVSVYIPVGNKNKFTPTPQDRGQTKVFLPGRKYKVFTVDFNGSNVVWTLNGRTSTASSNSAPCN